MITTEAYLKPVNTLELFTLGISKDCFTTTGILNISDLTPNQKTLDIQCLHLKIKGKLKFSTIQVLKYNGLNILMDGHHTVIAKLIKGQKKVKCKIYKID